MARVRLVRLAHPDRRDVGVKTFRYKIQKRDWFTWIDCAVFSAKDVLVAIDLYQEWKRAQRTQIITEDIIRED
jgi:hypothetical protein